MSKKSKEEIIEALGKMMFKEFDLGDPDKADVKTVLRALFINELNAVISTAIKLIGARETVRILEVYTHAFDILKQEILEDESGSK